MVRDLAGDAFIFLCKFCVVLLFVVTVVFGVALGCYYAFPDYPKFDLVTGASGISMEGSSHDR